MNILLFLGSGRWLDVVVAWEKSSSVAGGSSGFPLVRYLGNAAHTGPASEQLSVSAAQTSSDPETHKKEN